MNNKKTEFKFFSVTQWEKEQDYLRKKHSMGWKMVSVKWPGIYCFEKCSPEDVIYQLDYNQHGIAHKAEYVQIFADCGWEYLLDYVGYSYFRKPVSQMQEQEEIFCDDDSRLEMIKRVYRGRLIPLIIIFFGMIIPQLFIQMNAAYNMGRILFFAYAILLIVYIVVFLQFGIHYRKLKNRLDI